MKVCENIALMVNVVTIYLDAEFPHTSSMQKAFISWQVSFLLPLNT